MPTNITYEKVNIVDHIPFDSETFDVVHTRFVLLHVCLLPGTTWHATGALM